MSAAKPDGADDLTARVRRFWDERAPGYDRGARFERLLIRDSRAWVCSQAAGETLEVAAGTGRNFEFYPDGVELTAIDLSPGMLAIARERAAGLDRAVHLREADAQRLPFAGTSFDTVVCALSLCSVPDLHAAVAEMHRVLRTGGRLVLVDHVRSDVAPVLWLMRGLQRVNNRFVPNSGESMLRRPLEAVIAQGFVVERRERFKAGVVERLAGRKPA